MAVFFAFPVVQAAPLVQRPKACCFRCCTADASARTAAAGLADSFRPRAGLSAAEALLPGRHRVGSRSRLVSLQVAVRTEEITISGGIVRQQAKFDRYLAKRTVTNPARGPYHFRSPSKILWRTVRGYVLLTLLRGCQQTRGRHAGVCLQTPCQRPSTLGPEESCNWPCAAILASIPACGTPTDPCTTPTG